MKNKRLLPILLLSALFLVGCGGGNQPEPEPEPGPGGETTTYGVAINNKEALQTDFFLDSASRDLDVSLTPEGNPTLALSKGELTVTSSNTSVATVTGLGIHPVALGTTTITVTYHEKTDNVEIEIKDGSPVGRYGTTHLGTAEDPFTNEDALLVAKHAKYEGQVYYVRGTVDRWYAKPGSREDGMVAYYLTPAQEGGEQFEVYKCFKEKGAKLTEDDIWLGGVATAYGSFTSYGGQYETSSATFVSCTGEKPADPTTIEKTFSEVMQIGYALKDGGITYDRYKFNAFVSLKKGNNYFLTATKGEEITPTTETVNNKEYNNYKTAIELYGITDSKMQGKLLKGAEVTVEIFVKNYHGQLENDGAIVSLEVVTAGEAWPIVTIKKTAEEVYDLAMALTKTNTDTDDYYEFEAYIVEVTYAFSNGSASFKVGAAADSTEKLITVYRCGAAEGTDGTKFLVGAKLNIIGTLQKYVKDDSTPAVAELTNGKASILEEAPQQAAIEKTVEEAYDLAMALTENNKNTKEQYKIQGYIVKVTTAWSTSNKNLSYTLGTAANSTEKVLTVFRSGAAEGTSGPDLKAGDKVEIVANLQKYVKNESTDPVAELTNGVTELKEAFVLDATAVAVEPATAEVVIGKTVTLKANLTPENATSKVTWSSSDETKATVENGVVTGVAAGEVTITAKVSEEIKATCVVTVKEAGPKADVEFTGKELLGFDGSADIGYGTVKEATVSGITFTLTDVAAYKNQSGNIQLKKTSGEIKTKAETTKAISKIVLEQSGTKNVNANVFAASTVSALDTAEAATGTNYVYTFAADANIHAFKIKNNGSGAGYILSVSIYFAEEQAAPKADLPWYKDGTGNDANRIEGAGIWTWVNYGELGYANFAEFSAVKEQMQASYVSTPETNARIDTVSDDKADLHVARVYVVLGAAYNSGTLTLTIPAKDGASHFGTIVFADGVATSYNA